MALFATSTARRAGNRADEHTTFYRVDIILRLVLMPGRCYSLGTCISAAVAGGAYSSCGVFDDIQNRRALSHSNDDNASRRRLQRQRGNLKALRDR